MTGNDEQSGTDGYQYHSADSTHPTAYLFDKVLPLLERISSEEDRRVFELGCGNGVLAAKLAALGFDVTAVDTSASGVAFARAAHPDVRFEQASAYDPLGQTFGTFPIVVSLEVVEHLYAPRLFARTVYELLAPGGVAILSTPYHGYLKNLALAVTGKLDDHFGPLWDHGHIKFWSVKTLSALLKEEGFKNLEFHRAGRIPPLAKSMIAVAHKPL